MPWKIGDHGHDPRQIDLLAVIMLIVISIGAFVYVASSEFPTPHGTSTFIVPSQHVRW